MNMKEVEKIQEKLKSMKTELKEKYGIEKIGIFGSYVKGEQSEGSDLDVLVTFNKPIGLFKLVEMENELSEQLGVKVDLVTKSSLKPRIRDRVTNEVVYA